MLQVSPAQCMLPANGLVEMQLSFRPLAIGTLNVVVNIVDKDEGGLVDALLVASHSTAPSVSKHFEVDLPVGSLVQKKVRNVCYMRQQYLFS